MKFLAVFFIISFSVHAEDYFMTRKWSDNLGEHTLFFEKKTSIYKNKESLIVKQVTGRKVNWVLNDYVDSCDEDVKLNLIKNSIEIKNFFFGKGYTVLFAYKIGCVGGIDTVPVKYFAYNNGIKYSLRGEEHIIIGNDSYGGEREPIPDTNLKKNKKLLSYMRGKWKSVALTKY